MHLGAYLAYALPFLPDRVVGWACTSCSHRHQLFSVYSISWPRDPHNIGPKRLLSWWRYCLDCPDRVDRLLHAAALSTRCHLSRMAHTLRGVVRCANLYGSSASSHGSFPCSSPWGSSVSWWLPWLELAPFARCTPRLGVHCASLHPSLVGFYWLLRLGAHASFDGGGLARWFHGQPCSGERASCSSPPCPLLWFRNAISGSTSIGNAPSAPFRGPCGWHGMPDGPHLIAAATFVGLVGLAPFHVAPLLVWAASLWYPHARGSTSSSIQPGGPCACIHGGVLVWWMLFTANLWVQIVTSPPWHAHSSPSNS